MKFLTGLLCAIIFAVVGVATEAKAQTTYALTNSTSVPIMGFTIQTTCGPRGPINLPAGPFTMNIVLAPGCTVTGVVFRGAFFGLGYNGPVPPPMPPNGITVTATGTTFW